MKQLFPLLLIVVSFAWGPKKAHEKFLRDFYQLPNEAVQTIEWTYTTRQANDSTLPDALTSDNREFKFKDNRLVKIIAFDDFVIDIAQRDNEVVFTKTNQKSQALIETVKMTYDSTMSRVVRKGASHCGNTFGKASLILR